MNGLSVLGQKADQIELEFKSEVKNYKLILILVLSTRSNIPLKLLSLQIFDLIQCVNSTTK